MDISILDLQDQAIAHTDGLWNALGMALAGFGCVLLGGCPLRQLVLAGEGNTDSAITVFGLMAGAAVAHNFGLASSGEGPTANGKAAVIIGFVVLFVIAAVNSARKAEELKGNKVQYDLGSKSCQPIQIRDYSVETQQKFHLQRKGISFMKTVDARGLSCPEPVIRTKNALASGEKAYTVMVDNVTARENVSRFAMHQGYQVSWKEDGEDFILTLEK